MAQVAIENPQNEHRSVMLVVICLLGALGITAFILMFGTIENFEQTGLSTASRTLNQFTAVMLTCIALIVPLTSNLYSPRLVKLYVTHPLLVTGLSVLLLSHLLIMSLSFFPKGHPFERYIVASISVCFLLVMTGALPFLYGISQFLRPKYFLPALARKCIQDIQRLDRGRKAYQRSKELFETIDVIANIALTGMHRGDRQLVLYALHSLSQILLEFISEGITEDAAWRNAKAYFVPGLAQEGQEYLMRNRLWPEAYVLAQMLKVMEMATQKQHELLAELAGQLVDSAQLACMLRRDKVTELHIMAFNTLMREAVEDKDLRRFQNLSYHYRLLIEAFHETPERMHEATQHLLHYGNLSTKLGLRFGLETVVYDLGELVLNLAKHDEPRAVELVQVWVNPLWQDALAAGSALQKVAWRTLIRVYWEARAQGLDELKEVVYWRFLSDETIHREHAELVLDDNRELHFEFNDRLMRFAYLSPEAEALAREFTEEY